MSPENETLEAKNAGRLVVKFLIGLTAGLISAVFPRLSPLIFNPNLLDKIEFYNKDYFLICLIFGIIIGIVILVMYSDTQTTNRQLFLAALGIPALLSGGFSMNDTLYQGLELNQELAKLENEKQELIDVLSNKEEIEINSSEMIDLSLNLDFDKSTESSTLFVPFISSAYAQESTKKDKSYQFSPGVKFKSTYEEDMYFTVIESSYDSMSLVQRKNEIQDDTRLKELKILKSNNIYYLIFGNETNQSESLLKAIDIKNKYGLDPRLVKVKSQ